MRVCCRGFYKIKDSDWGEYQQKQDSDEKDDDEKKLKVGEDSTNKKAIELSLQEFDATSDSKDKDYFFLKQAVQRRNSRVKDPRNS